MKKNSLVIFFSIIIILMASCTSSRPSYVLDSDDMEDVLYDIHRAHFIQEQSGQGQNSAMQYALFLHVLKQHDVTQAEWDSSMVYYSRHANELEEVYTNLLNRLDYEASAMGAGMSEAADSSDIWKAERHILLTSDDLNASYQWKLDADTLVKPGEKMRIRFLALFLNQNSESRATALITIRLNNDSVIVRQQILTSSAIYNIEIADDDKIGVKSIGGLFMLSKASNSMPAMTPENNNPGNAVKSSQILAITDIKLFHEDAQKAMQEAARRDSINAANRPDTIGPQQPGNPGPPVNNMPQQLPPGVPTPPPPPPHHP